VRSDRERDAEMDRLLRAVKTDEPSAAAGACPAADDLAAYAERMLTDGEREVMDAHLAACRRCQEALALLATMPGSPTPAASPAPAWWRAGWKRWLVPVGAAATGVLLYVAIKPDAALQPVVPSRESVVASAPAQLRAPAPRALAETTRPAESDAPPAVKDRATAPPPRVEQPPPLVEMQARRSGVTGSGPQVSKARPTSVETSPERVVPPAMARDVTTPVAALVGAVTPAAPPPPPPPALPPAQAKAEAKEQARALPVVGGVPPPGKQAGDPGAAEALKPMTETVVVTGRTPLVQARALNALPILVSAKDNRDIRWRFGPGARIEGSADAGRTWRLQYSGTGELLTGFSPDGTTCWAVGAAGLVLRTTDGQAWAARPFPEPVDLSAVTATDALHATVTARDGRRFATEDGGATWKPVG